MAVAAAVARHEHDLQAVEHTEQELVGRLAERRSHPPPLGLFEAGDLVDAAAAQDTQHRHALLLVAVGVSSRPAKRGVFHGQT